MVKHSYKYILKPILFRFDPERVHDFFLKVGATTARLPLLTALIERAYGRHYPELSQEVAGITFKSPIGLSAGFDKDAKLVNILPRAGFGYQQVGTVTFNAYEGNPGKRLTRMPKSQGILVYYGLKNDGVEVISQRLAKRKFQSEFPVSVSVGKTNASYTASVEAGTKDYVDCLRHLEQHLDPEVVNFYTLNISCPNTFGGEPFTDPESLTKLCDQVAMLQIKKPIFVKLPLSGWDELEPLLKVLAEYEFIKGVIISNLEKDRTNPEFDSDELAKISKLSGGISGRALTSKAKSLVAKTYKNYGDRFVIVGVGGIFSAHDAYELIKSGATLVQLITGMIYSGPTLISEINRDLVRLLRADGYENVADAVGAGVEWLLSVFYASFSFAIPYHEWISRVDCWTNQPVLLQLHAQF